MRNKRRCPRQCCQRAGRVCRTDVICRCKCQAGARSSFRPGCGQHLGAFREQPRDQQRLARAGHHHGVRALPASMRATPVSMWTTPDLLLSAKESGQHRLPYSQCRCPGSTIFHVGSTSFHADSICVRAFPVPIGQLQLPRKWHWCPGITGFQVDNASFHFGSTSVGAAPSFMWLAFVSRQHQFPCKQH